MKVACQGADSIAGVAALISTMPSQIAASCKLAKPTAFLLMNGTADPVAPYNGGVARLNGTTIEVVSSEATLAPFLAQANCGKERITQEIPDRDPNDGSRVTLERFAGCTSIVELVRINGGGHTLPGRPVREDRGIPVGAQNNDVSTPRVVWDFIRRVAR